MSRTTIDELSKRFGRDGRSSMGSGGRSPDDTK